MKSTRPLFAILFLIHFAYADQPPLHQPIKDHQGNYVERFKVELDFNNDGLDDLALSQGTHLFGNGSGPFEIYLKQKAGTYKKVGTISNHATTFAVEHYQNKHFIWVYSHGSSSSGSLGYYILNNETLSKPKTIEIHPGDSGTDIGRKLFKSIFKNSPKPKRSVTKNGVVTW